MPIGSQKVKWVHRIDTDLSELGCDDAEWIQLAEDKDLWQAVLNTLMKQTSGLGKDGNFLYWLCDSSIIILLRLISYVW